MVAEDSKQICKILTAEAHINHVILNQFRVTKLKSGCIINFIEYNLRIINFYVIIYTTKMDLYIYMIHLEICRFFGDFNFDQSLWF